MKSLNKCLIVIFLLVSPPLTLAATDPGLEFEPGSTPAQITANYVGIINAHMSSRFAVGIVSRMTPYELYRMRQVYVELGGNGAYLDGLVRTYTRHPNLYNKYKYASALNWQDLVPAPTPIAGGPKMQLKTTAAMHVRAASPSLDFTFEQIYLEYKTAPFASLSTSSALYETAEFASRRLVPTYYAGYAVGSAINYLIETYAPQFDTDIGGTIDQMIQQLKAASTDVQKGHAADAIRAAFGQPPLLSAGGQWGYGFNGFGVTLVFMQRAGFITIIPSTDSDKGK